MAALKVFGPNTKSSLIIGGGGGSQALACFDFIIGALLLNY